MTCPFCCHLKWEILSFFLGDFPCRTHRAVMENKKPSHIPRDSHPTPHRVKPLGFNRSTAALGVVEQAKHQELPHTDPAGHFLEMSLSPGEGQYLRDTHTKLLWGQEKQFKILLKSRSNYLTPLSPAQGCRFPLTSLGLSHLPGMPQLLSGAALPQLTPSFNTKRV